MTEDQEDSLVALAEIHDGLHSRWSPHPGQVDIGRAIFYEGSKQIFACCGRNFGKSQLAGYCSWRYCQENPGVGVYIFEPYNNQAREILWASNVIQSFGPQEWIESVNNTEMRITFKNGSFIKVTGSDNFEAYRGIKPKGLVIFDEYKDLRPEFIESFMPNIAAFEPPIMMIGTPPEVENHFTQLMDIAKASDKWRFFYAPTEANPYISKEWLAQEKARLYAIGEETTWLREYMALFVKGGKRHLVPAFITMEKKINLPIDPNKWQLFTVFDPAGSSTFGVLFILFNPYTKHHKVWKEIYEQDAQRMTARGIWDQSKPIIADAKLLGISSFEYVYDEAAAFFRNEMNEYATDVWLQPTQKSKTERGEGLSIFREVIADGLLEVSPECVKFIWEVENYIKDENDKIPKKNDHLIDCYLYFLQAAGFEFIKREPPKPHDPLLTHRFERLEDNLDFRNENDAFEFEGGSSEEL